jgi:ubiquinone/menaquinone biosynthesis C-methylase UbiE
MVGAILRGVTQRPSEEQVQREYYAQTAHQYDAAHMTSGGEHHMALAFMVGALEYLDAHSVLDVGAGTGRVLRYLKAHAPAVRRAGVEPVEELRRVAYEQGVAIDEIRAGDARQLPFADESFDLVCEFGVLHHVSDSGQVVAEMLRVARKAILISDSNNFGQGPAWMRAIKQALHAVGLWGVADLLKTRGLGYSITDGDGLSYSYSVFNDYAMVRARCRSVHVLNTGDASPNPYRSATHVALLGVK